MLLTVLYGVRLHDQREFLNLAENDNSASASGCREKNVQQNILQIHNDSIYNIKAEAP